MLTPISSTLSNLSFSLRHLQVYSKLLWHDYGELLATFVSIQILGLNMGLLVGTIAAFL